MPIGPGRRGRRGVIGPRPVARTAAVVARWRDTLTSAEVAEYEARAVAELGAECARWLATGKTV